MKIINNWKYKGWGNAKFLYWKSINRCGHRFFVIILFGIACWHISKNKVMGW